MKDTFLERLRFEKSILHLKKQYGEDDLFFAFYTQEDGNNLLYIIKLNNVVLFSCVLKTFLIKRMDKLFQDFHLKF